MPRLPDWARRGRSGWRWVGDERPPFAISPKEGQESIWDYPRPPRIEPDGRHVLVGLGGTVVAESDRSLRVLETGSPPTFYLPPGDVRLDLLVAGRGASRCEWKGDARYWDVVLPDRRIPRAGWSYPAPFPEFEPIRGFLSFYPALLECTVGGAPVKPQPGGFYGGWITAELVGPFKGEPGTEGW